jgi:hypothetical protein
VLVPLIDLLRTFGHSTKAEWLGERLALLQQGHGTVQTLVELHSIVPGMGGLMDLYLGEGSAESETANAELARLADQLYEWTR